MEVLDFKSSSDGKGPSFCNGTTILNGKSENAEAKISPVKENQPAREEQKEKLSCGIHI